MRLPALLLLLATLPAAPLLAQETDREAEAAAMVERATERFKARIKANPELEDARDMLEWGEMDFEELFAGFQGSWIPDSTLLHTLDLVHRSLPDASVEMCALMAQAEADSLEGSEALGSWMLARADSALVEEWFALAEEWLVAGAHGLDSPWVEPEPINEALVTTLFLRIISGLTPEEQMLFGQAVAEAGAEMPNEAKSCELGMLVFHAFFRLAPEEQLVLTRALMTVIETYEPEAAEAELTGVTEKRS